jgi:hypothetical protein
MSGLLYRITGTGCQIEVFDRHITVVERRVGGTITEELEHLAALRDRGVLTDAEFAAAKQRLFAEGQ